MIQVNFYKFFRKVSYSTKHVLPIIPSRYKSTISTEEKGIIQCDLCEMRFSTKDELSNNIAKDHN